MGHTHSHCKLAFVKPLLIFGNASDSWLPFAVFLGCDSRLFSSETAQDHSLSVSMCEDGVAGKSSLKQHPQHKQQAQIIFSSASGGRSSRNSSSRNAEAARATLAEFCGVLGWVEWGFGLFWAVLAVLGGVWGCSGSVLFCFFVFLVCLRCFGVFGGCAWWFGDSDFVFTRGVRGGLPNHLKPLLLHSDAGFACHVDQASRRRPVGQGRRRSNRPAADRSDF